MPLSNSLDAELDFIHRASVRPVRDNGTNLLETFNVFIGVFTNLGVPLLRIVVLLETLARLLHNVRRVFNLGVHILLGG